MLQDCGRVQPAVLTCCCCCCIRLLVLGVKVPGTCSLRLAKGGSRCQLPGGGESASKPLPMQLTSLKLPVNLALSSGVWNTATISPSGCFCASLAIAAVVDGQAGSRGRRRALVCASSWSPLLQLLRAVDLDRWLDLSNRCIQVWEYPVGGGPDLLLLWSKEQH